MGRLPAESLKRCLKVSLIREALQHLPKTLDETYSRMLSAIDEAYREDAKNALIWLAFSERPLQLEELAEATVIHPRSYPPFDPEERFPDPRNVLEILSSLVVINDLEDNFTPVFAMEDDQHIYSQDTGKATPSTVTLAHYTVK
jgi:hypothetical protein